MANDAGHGIASSMPVRIGCRGRQRKPISAPRIVPAPIAEVAMPNVARVSYSSIDTVAPSVCHGPNDVSSPIENARMIAQIQLRERTSVQPSRSSVTTVVRRAELAPLARAQREQERGGDEERRGVDRERRAGPDAEHEHGRQRRAGELGDGLDRAERRLRRLDLALRHRLRDQPGVGGPEERLGRAERRLDQRDRPDLDVAGEDQRGQQRVQPEAHEVGHDHHAVPRQPVGPHAADQQEADERERVRREHDPDVARRADVGDVQRERDEHDPVAERARRLAEQQQPEVTVGEHSLHDPASWPRWTSTSCSMPGSAPGRAATAPGSNPCARSRSPTRTR